MRFLARTGLSLASALLASQLVYAAPKSFRGCSHKLKESIAGPPHGWTPVAAAPKDHVIDLKIALPQPNFGTLEKHLWEVSDPSHTRYGAHLSKEEVDELMSPHPESLSIVDEWLASHGFDESQLVRSPAKDWVTIRVPVVVAEEMLGTTYHIYEHSASGDSIVRTTSYSLPEVLHDHIDLVQPTTMFARFKPMKSSLHWSTLTPASPSTSTGTITGPAGNQVDASCNETVTVTCLKQLYNSVDYNTTATNGNQIGLTGYLGQYANYDDLEQFYELEVPDAYGSNFTFVSVNGGQNDQDPADAGVEANLDTQFGFGLTYPTPGTFWSTAGEPPFIPDSLEANDTNEPYSYWLSYILDQTDIPQAISTSYGDDEQTVPYSYASRVCNGFAALGARGISIMFSSGDGGVGDGDADPATQECYSNDGTNRTIFIPGFPASCPYVTAVGGTVNIPETAVFFSGGGFSDYFARPSYQDSAVEGYLEKLVPGTYEGLYNASGRGYPDVAAQAYNFLIVYQGQTGYVAGTSCASPTFTAFVSLLNDARINAGKSSLGFLNPFIYSGGYAGLNDITEGNNPGCGTEGFNATIGWDPGTYCVPDPAHRQN
ncbi:tripeptidyl peptidase A [Coniophora puteana RWD-64-598 SS2]|uniref:tripeptidyl-peptidase II n=1 Tax=Coniophora puteana (strain RWD-64-598) TaxID=741705 RepID=A0A5M3MB70_CONPW|nr:tripeptidyl peptidase A [Coniophora puteana RWD-64-598 SS2]EIW76307.1 tripeptidyl peptidase A [Coniophora puteana RWD-64-598 SS2]